MQFSTRYLANDALAALSLIKSRIDDDAIGCSLFYENYLRSLLGREVSTWSEEQENLKTIKTSNYVPSIVSELEQLSIDDIDLVIGLLELIKRIKREHIVIKSVRVMGDNIVIRGLRNGNT